MTVVSIPGCWAPEPDSIHLVCSKIRTLEGVVIGFHEGREGAGGEVQSPCGIWLVVVDGAEPELSGAFGAGPGLEEFQALLIFDDVGYEVVVMNFGVVVEGEDELFEVVAALNGSCGGAGLLYCGEQERDEYGDDRDDDEKFDEGEGVSAASVGCHESWIIPEVVRYRSHGW